MDLEKDEELNDVLKKLQNMENLHYPSGPIYTKSGKLAAWQCREENELETIYNVVESHVPSLRFTATYRYERATEANAEPLEKVIPLCKDNFSFQCNINSQDKIKNMLQQLKDMPEEWTIIHLTSSFNIKENVNTYLGKRYTSPLHLAVLDCGQEAKLPYMITLEPPKDRISGKMIEIMEEMHSILADNVGTLETFKPLVGKTISLMKKEEYNRKRHALNRRLENLVKQMQDKWMGEWRCLLIGKFAESETEKLVASKIEEILSNHNCVNVSDKNRKLLMQVVKGGDVLNRMELKNALKYLFPEEQHKDLISSLNMIQNIASKHCFAKQRKHSVILIVDEKLDVLPWEMIDVLQDHPVSRMPSLHFTYALFKEHESSIVKGLKVNINPKCGTYIVNPDLDLKNMENRLKHFFEYWLPNWHGTIGVQPSEESFKNMLTNSSIFVYCGHGNGSQFFGSDKIKKMKIGAVVLLFGCGSVKLLSLGPEVEMTGNYQMYLIACSPCVLGFLWPVTDLDTDLVTTEFISQWVPSSAPTHWKYIDKKSWETTGSFNPDIHKDNLSASEKHEPELLRALCRAKKAGRQYIMKAAYVARGLPVKVES